MGRLGSSSVRGMRSRAREGMATLALALLLLARPALAVGEGSGTRLGHGGESLGNRASGTMRKGSLAPAARQSLKSLQRLQPFSTTTTTTSSSTSTTSTATTSSTTTVGQNSSPGPAPLPSGYPTVDNCSLTGAITDSSGNCYFPTGYRLCISTVSSPYQCTGCAASPAWSNFSGTSPSADTAYVKLEQCP
jgi:hypothetical protein